MATATLELPPDQPTSRVRSVRVALDVETSSFDTMNLVVTAVGDATGVDEIRRDLYISGMGKNYHVNFHIPEDVSGSFKLQTTGKITPDTESGSGSPEMVTVTSNIVIISYDTVSQVDARWGELEYRDNGEIVLPVNFFVRNSEGDEVPENVIWFDKTDCEIEPISGDSIVDMRYTLFGQNDAYMLVFLPVVGTAGSFKVSFRGDIVKTTNILRDNVVVSPKLVPFYRSA